MHKVHSLKSLVILALLLLVTAPAALAKPPAPTTNGVFAVIPACTPITTNTTWTTGNIYVVQNCNLAIANGATLTIQPGVIVKFWGWAPGYGSGMGSVAVIVNGAIKPRAALLSGSYTVAIQTWSHGPGRQRAGAGVLLEFQRLRRLRLDLSYSSPPDLAVESI